MKMNPNSYNRYQAVRRGGFYDAVVCRMLDDCPFELRVTYIDLQCGKHEEFCQSYKSAFFRVREVQALFQRRGSRMTKHLIGVYNLDTGQRWSCDNRS